jgi:hypothetical protein
MNVDVIHDRLKNYDIRSKQAEENAIKEICQEIALAGLSREGFFKNALFQGGTCLRIIHGLKRFSEDLDFILNSPNQAFDWTPYLRAISTEFEAFGLSLEVIDRQDADNTIKKAFLKESSFGKVLNLRYPRFPSDKQKILIKLEIDINPPFGSIPETHYLNYPYPFPIVTQDLSNLFAGKCHALLSREYVKGRDWFDFIWYVQNQYPINYDFLKNALEQSGPHTDIPIRLTKPWLVHALETKINSLDWEAASADVIKFLPSEFSHTVNQWNSPLFLSLLTQLQ